MAFMVRRLRRGEERRFESVTPGPDGDDVPVYRKTRRFNPYVGKNYEGMVTFRWSWSTQGYWRLIGYFVPVNRELLDNNEWIPEHQLDALLRVKATFRAETRNGRKNYIAWDGPLCLKVPRGADFKPDEEAEYLLIERGNYADVVLLTDIQASSSTALVAVARESGVIDDEDLRVVFTEHADASGKRWYKKHVIYEYLSDRDDASLKVTAASTKAELRKAFNAKMKKCSPDSLCAALGGVDKAKAKYPWFMVVVDSTARAMKQAYENAVELLERREKREGKKPAPPATVPVAAAATVTVPAPEPTPPPTAAAFFGLSDEDEDMPSPEEDVMAEEVDQRVYSAAEVLAQAAQEAKVSLTALSEMSAEERQVHVERAKAVLRSADPTCAFAQGV